MLEQFGENVHMLVGEGISQKSILQHEFETRAPPESSRPF